VSRLIVNAPVLRCFLRPSLTEVPSLHRSYPASSVLRTSPPPHTAQPVSHELPVDPDCDHRWGFPCCVWSPMPTCHRHYPGRCDGACSLVSLHRRRPSLCNSQVGSCNCCFGTCSAFTHVMACTLAESLATLSIESSGSFVASAIVSIATGWNEPVPGRELHPLKSSAFSRRTVTPIDIQCLECAGAFPYSYSTSGRDGFPVWTLSNSGQVRSF